MRPWLWLPPQWAHDLSPYYLKLYGRIKSHAPPEWRPLEWRGLRFPNRLGLAGGVDKNADTVPAWWALGAGFVEVGTITPRSQTGNPGKVMGRHTSSQALWNRMGFPSQGMESVLRRLQQLPQARPTPVFANIGKNRITPLERASEDYVACLRHLKGWVDGFVVNISSPNTEGLRELLKPAHLREFLAPIVEANQDGSAPLLLKLSPDIESEDLEKALDVSVELGIDGWIVSNTTNGAREGLSFPEGGGVSGAPLAPRSKQMLRSVVSHLGERRKDRLIVSAGGVLTPQDVFERLDMGADLVQVYTALVFQGPGFFRQVAKQAQL